MTASTAELASRSAACACAAASPARTTRLVVTRLLAIDRMDSLLEPSTGRRRAKSPSPLVMRRGGEATGSIGVSVWLASGGTAANGCCSVAALSGMASLIAALAEYATEQFGCGTGADLAHDGGPITFDGSCTQAEIPCNFLVGLADRKPGQHLALAGGQRLAAGNVQRHR